MTNFEDPESNELAPLFRSAASGDPVALACLWKQMEPRARAIAVAELGGRLVGKVDADDLVQLAFLELSQGMSELEYHGDSSLFAWLHVVVRRDILDLRKHLQQVPVRRESEGPDDQILFELIGSPELSVSRAVRRQETIRVLHQAVEQLSEPDRSVVRQRLEGRTLAEIGESLSLSISKTYAALKHGVRSLAKVMGGPSRHSVRGMTSAE